MAMASSSQTVFVITVLGIQLHHQAASSSCSDVAWIQVLLVVLLVPTKNLGANPAAGYHEFSGYEWKVNDSHGFHGYSYIFMDTNILMDLFTDFNGTTGVLVPEFFLYINEYGQW